MAMTNHLPAVEIGRATEQLRQERETFDQQKDHEERWFSLRVRMGYVAVVSIPSILALSGFVIINADVFPSFVINMASGALFVDGLGLFVAIWKMILNPASVGRLQPVTRSSLIRVQRD